MLQYYHTIHSKKQPGHCSRVHDLVKLLPSSINLADIYYEPLTSLYQVEELRLLFKEWFPIEYPDEFYNGLLEDEYTKTIFALYDMKYKGIKCTVIVGALLYYFMPIDTDIFPDFNPDSECVYLMSIGVIDELRNKGLASLLLKKLYETVRENLAISLIYLDVIEYNKAAINFYEKNRYQKITTKKDYYELSNEKYDSFVYALCYPDFNNILK